MSKVCQITGKKAQIGNNVSHSKHRTKRSFDVNLFSKKFFWVEQDCWINLKISAAGLRLINKVGLDAAIRQAVDKGYLTWNDLEKKVNSIRGSWDEHENYSRYMSKDDSFEKELPGIKDRMRELALLGMEFPEPANKSYGDKALEGAN